MPLVDSWFNPPGLPVQLSASVPGSLIANAVIAPPDTVVTLALTPVRVFPPESVAFARVTISFTA